MRIKEGFMLRTAAGIHMVVPVGEASTVLNGMIRLNESGRFLWEKLEAGTDRASLAKALAAEYGLPAEKADRDVDAFLQTLRTVGCIEE